MKSEQERMEKLLKNELKKEAEKTIEEVEADESLKDIALPDELDAGLRAKIKQYEAEQAAYENLSEQDKEAIRIGREFQIQRANDGNGDDDGDDGNGGGEGPSGGGSVEENYGERRVVHFRKRRRMAFALVAIVVVMVMGFGMTSIGGKPFIPQLFEQMLAGRKNINIDTEDKCEALSESTKEDEAYQNIKDKFGFDAVALWYLPEGTEFLESVIDTGLQEAYLLYEYDDNILEYRIIVNYTSKSFGYDIEDELLDEKEVLVSEVPVSIKHYRISDSNINQYMIQYKYKGINYILTTTLNEDEIEKIVNNLKFS